MLEDVGGLVLSSFQKLHQRFSFVLDVLLIMLGLDLLLLAITLLLHMQQGGTSFACAMFTDQLVTQVRAILAHCFCGSRSQVRTWSFGDKGVLDRLDWTWWQPWDVAYKLKGLGVGGFFRLVPA